MRGKGDILQKKAGLNLQKKAGRKRRKGKRREDLSLKKGGGRRKKKDSAPSYVSGDYSFIHHYKAIHFQI